MNDAHYMAFSCGRFWEQASAMPQIPGCMASKHRSTQMDESLDQMSSESSQLIQSINQTLGDFLVCQN